MRMSYSLVQHYQGRIACCGRTLDADDANNWASKNTNRFVIVERKRVG